jgi:hypothetical protein
MDNNMSTTLEDLYKQRANLRGKAKLLQEQIDPINTQIKSIEDDIKVVDMAINHLKHPCPCVRLNEDIGVFDMIQQDKANRNPFGLGYVAACLSADKNCPICHGTGVPK